MIENCAVTNCADQGIQGDNDCGQIVGNYVDMIGGAPSPKTRRNPTTGGLHPVAGTRDGLRHDLYTGGGLIENNFLGRALSGSCANLACEQLTETTVFRNNVCYGGQESAVTLNGGNTILTGNVMIGTQPQFADGAQPPDSPSGLKIFEPEPNVIVSGNYAEGSYYGGLQYWGNDQAPQSC